MKRDFLGTILNPFTGNYLKSLNHMNNRLSKDIAHITNNPSAIQCCAQAPKMEIKKPESPLVKQ